MFTKTKKVLNASVKEVINIFKLFIRNILNLFKTWWRQKWGKKIIDFVLTIIFCLTVREIGMMVFNMSMMNNMSDLQTYQTVLYSVLLNVVAFSLYIYFAELFMLLCLGGTSIITNEFKSNIEKRMQPLTE